MVDGGLTRASGVDPGSASDHGLALENTCTSELRQTHRIHAEGMRDDSHSGRWSIGADGKAHRTRLGRHLLLAGFEKRSAFSQLISEIVRFQPQNPKKKSTSQKMLQHWPKIGQTETSRLS